MPAQFELKTKKKVINLHTSLSAGFYWMISNKTTVIGASQSNCSIRDLDLTALLKYMNFKRGFRGNLETYGRVCNEKIDAHRFLP